MVLPCGSGPMAIGCFFFRSSSIKVEQHICNVTVSGSIPFPGAKHGTIEFLVAGEWNVYTIRAS